MPNLKEVRNRIVSVNSTMQITSAMKMVSAAKLRRAQDNVVKMRPYAEKLTEILSNLSVGLESSENPYSIEREAEKILLVVITSNRGLCGAFNMNVIKKAKAYAEEHYPNKEVTTLTIGKKGYDAFRRGEWFKDSKEFPLNHSDVFLDMSYEAVSEIAIQIMKAFEAGKFDRVALFYNKFKNAAVQEVMAESYLPARPKNNSLTSNVEYIFEPNKQEILDELIPKSLKTQLFKAVLDSIASEHGARMTAMHKATDNAKEMISELKLSYNKARQAAITTEILEIVAGAEALDG